jgi:antitoxin ParD1/3/4
MKRRLLSEDADACQVQERKARLAFLDASIARGVADADAGRVTPAGKAFDRIELELSAKAVAKRS